MLKPLRQLPKVGKHSSRLGVTVHQSRFLSGITKSAQNIYPFDPFDVRGKVIVTTGGGRGLGFEMAHQLSNSGAHVNVLDVLEHPEAEFQAAQDRLSPFGGSLKYIRADVTVVGDVDVIMQSIADRHGRLDGLIAAAGIQRTGDAIRQSQNTVEEVMNTNFFGVFNCATACGKQMLEKKCPGSIVLVASMSGLIANKGMFCSVYNSSKAAVIQLARNLAQEWGPITDTGRGGIRVNSLCPGHIYTPMVEKTMKDNPGAGETWEQENMLGKIAWPWEFRGVSLFLMSEASSYMTGNALIMDGGHTAW